MIVKNAVNKKNPHQPKPVGVKGGEEKKELTFLSDFAFRFGLNSRLSFSSYFCHYGTLIKSSTCFSILLTLA